jgi:hypothetical protein
VTVRRVRSLGVVIAAVAFLSIASAAAAEPRGVFVAHCRFSHELSDDPIVHPDDPGASHLHAFFGSTATKATSTLEDLEAARTTCTLSADTAAYWFPVASMDGVEITPTFAKVYYFGVVSQHVSALPSGLQVIAGDATASSAADNPNVTWSCGAKGTNRTPIVNHPYDCTRLADRWRFVDSVVARVQLPSCWDGTGLAPTDLAYPEGRVCPEGFDTQLAVPRMQLHLGLLDPCPRARACRPGGTGPNVSLELSSGPFFTFHADLWNAWDQRALERLVARCLDRHFRCGVVSDP